MTILSECINTTHDNAYDYKKVTYSDNSVKYFFIGKTGKYKTKFPKWTEAKDDKKYGTIRRNAIIENVIFDCTPSQPSSNNISLPLLRPQNIPISISGSLAGTSPSTSQTSNIIDNTPIITYSVGTAVDTYSNNPLVGALVKINTFTTTTDKNGSFKIPFEEIPDFSPSTSPNKIQLSILDYQALDITPYKGDGEIKEDLGIIRLTPLLNSLDNEKISSSQLKSEQIEEVSSSKKDFKYFAQKKLIDLINNIKSTLVPLILTLIARFGLSQIEKLLQQGQPNINDIKDQIVCPTPQELSNIISRKNKTVKQLNNAIKTIDITTKALGITGGVITSLEIAFNILKNLPIPSAVPPGIGLPINVILGVQDGKDKIGKIITSLKTTNAGLLSILVILRQVLTQAVQYLNLLDILVQHCAPDSSQEQISAELTALTTQQSNQESPVVINVNGFEMGVETETTTKPLKRRRAIARNKSGVVMLQGEWSFSSIDQILIDELVFYIQVNDLKAD